MPALARTTPRFATVADLPSPLCVLVTTMLLAPVGGGPQDVGPKDPVRLRGGRPPARGADQVGALAATPVRHPGDHAEDGSFQVLLDLVGGPQPSGHPVTDERQADPECEPRGETEEHVHPVDRD